MHELMHMTTILVMMVGLFRRMKMYDKTNFQDILNTITNYHSACFDAGEKPIKNLSLWKMYEETVRLRKSHAPQHY